MSQSAIVSPITPAAVRDEVDRLLAARQRLSGQSVEAIIDVLDRTVAVWLDPHAPWREWAESQLARETGFSSEMLRHGLPILLEPLRADGIRRLLDEELGGSAAIDARDPGLSLVAHVLPGNVPALAATSICLTLAVKAAALVKSAAGDRWFPRAFVRSLHEIDAEVGACASALYWFGGDQDCEREAFERADVVDAAGSDEAIDGLRSRLKGRFIGRGGRISFAFVGAEVARGDDATLAQVGEGLGEDISLWDQQGCLSPQVVFVEGDLATAERAAQAVAGGLERWLLRLPARQLSFPAQTAVLNFRQEAEWRAATTGGTTIGSDTGAWMLVLERVAALRPTCLQRTVRVQPVRGIEELSGVLAPMKQWLECAGLGVAPARIATVTSALRDAGVHRVCAAGQMQRPDLSWKPGGLPRVAGWFAK